MGFFLFLLHIFVLILLVPRPVDRLHSILPSCQRIRVYSNRRGKCLELIVRQIQSIRICMFMRVLRISTKCMRTNMDNSSSTIPKNGTRSSPPECKFPRGRSGRLNFSSPYFHVEFPQHVPLPCFFCLSYVLFAVMDAWSPRHLNIV